MNDLLGKSALKSLTLVFPWSLVMAMPARIFSPLTDIDVHVFEVQLLGFLGDPMGELQTAMFDKVLFNGDPLVINPDLFGPSANREEFSHFPDLLLSPNSFDSQHGRNPNDQDNRGSIDIDDPLWDANVGRK